MYQHIICSYCEITFHCTDIQDFIYPFISCKHLDWPHFLAIMSNAAVSVCVQMFVWVCIFISVGCMCRSGIAESHGSFIFNICEAANMFSEGAAPF